MIDVRPFASLGRFEVDWLLGLHHFSFGEYHNPERMGFGPLRVWNDDTFHPEGGFPMHGHRDMEIISYVRTGAISHEDHLGNKGRTEAGNVQVMTAGTGIRHSEYNYEADDTLIFQIWIETRETGLTPSWAARAFPAGDRAGQLVVLASGRDGDGNGPLPIHQDAALLAATLEAGQSVVHEFMPGRRAYLVPTRGALEINGVAVGERDGVAVADEERIEIRAVGTGEIVLVDLP
jgi:redox-sensitive bicupin YhaK (pirin superfamily)